MENIKTNKRTCLLEAANKLVHQQGFNQTALADIAKAGQVPSKGTQPADLALHLLSALQGASLLTHTFNQPDLIVRETARLKNGWVPYEDMSQRSAYPMPRCLNYCWG